MNKKLTLALFATALLLSGGIYLATEEAETAEPAGDEAKLTENELQALEDLQFLFDNEPVQETAVPLCPYRRCSRDCTRDTAILGYNDTGRTQCQKLDGSVLTCGGGQTVHGVVGNCTPIGQCTPDSWQSGFYCN
ncbi:MAG: hypothetical protein GY716_01945 [bacterium]|nr:hypothetical protein [bacterium]